MSTPLHDDAQAQAQAAQYDAPLAAEQRGLWYLHQLSPDGGAYHLLFSLEAELLGHDLPAQAAQLLVDLTAEYPVLRTALVDTQQGPVQRVQPGVQPDVRITAAEGWSDAVLRQRARLDSRAPFDFARAPLWRMQLYRRGPARWLMVFVVHHVLLDFWSLGLLLQDFAGRLGIAAPAAHPLDGRGYADYARRQQARLAEPQRCAAWLAYWRAQLEGAPAVHGLPMDTPRGVAHVHDGRTLAFAFDAETSESLRRAARALDATPFMVLLAAYAVLLQRVSGDEDLVIATPIAGRSERAQRHQLGQFVNTVALRLRPDRSAGFRALLHQVRELVTEHGEQGIVDFKLLEAQKIG